MNSQQQSDAWVIEQLGREIASLRWLLDAEQGATEASVQAENGLLDSLEKLTENWERDPGPNDRMLLQSDAELSCACELRELLKSHRPKAGVGDASSGKPTALPEEQTTPAPSPGKEELNWQAACEYAMKVIENYAMDIRSDPRLIEEGFCQGTVYKEALRDILDIAEAGPEAKP